MRAEFEAGSTFAHYRIEARVGRGGMGIVYRATDLSLERPVALKLIAPELAEDERFRSRFLRESRLAASLDHPGVVPIYEAGEQHGQLFIAMRYVEGDDLHALLRREETLAAERALAICGQVAEALDAAHANGLVHRDVKPGNVLLDGREHAYLSDFGLTKQLGGASTKTGQIVGTFDYLAPEQIRGEDVDARTDSYSLACVLYECLAARPPFRRQTEAEVLWAHMQEAPPPLPEFPALDSVFERALSKTRDERYGSCRELIEAAREALRIGVAEGVATIMFTDVEGSTALATRLGDVVAKELIDEQRRIVREQVATHGGRVIDSIGDGFMVAFESARRALVCALTVQQAMLERERSDPARTLRLRIGLNAGEVLERGGHPFGATVNAAQRVAAAAKGGEVLASDAVRQLAGTTPGISFRDRGRVRLKGFGEPWRLHEVVSADRAVERRVPWRVKVPARPRVTLGRVRVGRALALLGTLLVAGAIAAVVAMITRDDSQLVRLGNGVAAIDPARGRVASLTELEMVPGNVAVGEGAVWAITEDETVLRIDPQTKQILETFEPGGLPSEIAAGEGAVWIGNAGGRDFTNTTISVSRIDVESTSVTRTVKLPGGDSGVLPTAGLPRLAVGAGAVWAINPDGSVSRIDPETGALTKIDLEFPAWTIAAGEEGVWFLSLDNASAVMRIDPRSNRVSQTIRVGAEELLWGIAVGAGSVWATARGGGVLWRIEPGRRPYARTIDVGVGVTFVTFGEGAVWTGNYIDGTVVQVDPRTNTVAARTSIGAPQALAAGAGAAWVSVAGATTEGALTTSACGEVVSGPGKPDVLIASDFPLQGPGSAEPRAIANAVRFVLERRGFRAGEHTVGYQSCDVSTAQTGGFEFRKCAANASAYAHAEQLVAVIGTYSSFCAEVEIPILNRAPGGPVAIISPSNTASNLTRGGPLALSRGEPQVFYPTGVRNFFRVAPREDLQGVAHALLAKQLRLTRVSVLHPRDSDWKIEHADPFRRAARRLGIAVVGPGAFDPEAKSYDALASRVAGSRAQGVFLTGVMFEGGDRVLKALRARLGAGVKIMVTDQFLPIGELLKRLGAAARGVYVSAADVPPAARDLSPEGERFVRDFGGFDTPMAFVLPAAQAAEVVLRAIARSDGTRASVLAELRATDVKDGLLGRFRFDRNGDITPVAVPILRVIGEGSPGEGVFAFFRGAVVDRVIHVQAAHAP